MAAFAMTRIRSLRRHSLIAFVLTIASCSESGTPVETVVPADAATAVDASASDGGGSIDGGGTAWTPVAEPTNGPLMVWGALVADIDPERAVLFGGTTATAFGGTTLDSAYLYEWIEGGLVATEIGSGSGPAARYCGCAVHDETRGVVIVAGGRDLEGPFLAEAETWELDLEANTWHRWSGSTPPATLGCMLAQTDDGQVYWFGGASPSGATNTLYRAEGEEWETVAINGDAPPARYDGVLWADPQGLLLFAGSAAAFNADFYSDVWRFADGSWTRIDAGEGVRGRRVPWFRPTGDGFVFHGGLDENMNPMAGLYRWTFEGGFEELSVEAPLEPRGFAAALPTPEGYGAMLSGYDGDGPVREILWLR
ncbi:MAG: hypothetical protein KC464_34295 [Myxococcales bacterium]|nr:hypothetical protein [Myxococcales bacterium]